MAERTDPGSPGLSTSESALIVKRLLNFGVEIVNGVGQILLKLRPRGMSIFLKIVDLGAQFVPGLLEVFDGLFLSGIAFGLGLAAQFR